jgi:PIN domain nuclease of toxin-antitoxin system
MEELQVVHLDTNILIWLYDGRADRLSKAASRMIETRRLLTSAATVYELEVLHESGRRRIPAMKLISALGMDLGLEICNLPFRTVVNHALAEAWTRDPWDRLIVANAKAAGAPLVTSDETIRHHYSRAIW